MAPPDYHRKPAAWPEPLISADAGSTRLGWKSSGVILHQMDKVTLTVRVFRTPKAAALDLMHRRGTGTSSLSNGSMQAKAHAALRVAGAIALCAALAASLSLAFQHQDLEFRSKLPLVFLIVVVLVARKMGEAAAIMGTIAAGLVFATLLFQPLGSLGVATKPARTSLAWFLLGGMVSAHLLSPPSKKTRRHNSDLSHNSSDAE